MVKIISAEIWMLEIILLLVYVSTPISRQFIIITNIIILILTNGETTLTAQAVKYNIGFYLN